MANTLLITKKTSGEYSFIVNGDIASEILNIRNDLTVTAGKCHFKTSNGANLIKEQNITPSDVTLVASGTFTFTTVYQLFAKLKEVGFFDWINGIGTIGAGATSFSELDDTFNYFGKAGKAVVVSDDELKLEAITIYNYRRLVDLEDTFDAIVPNKMLATDSNGTGIILRDIPQTQVDNLPFNNKITAKTGFTLVGLDLTINPLWEWILQSIGYTNLEAQVKTFPLASTGLQRIDYVIPNTSNGFDVITGQESVTAIAPQIPYDGVYVTYLLITDSTIVDNGEPDLSSYATTQYVDEKDALKLAKDGYIGTATSLHNEITSLDEDLNTRIDDVVYQNGLDLALKLNTADYNQHFKGVYLTEVALNTAHPTASIGDYAQVNEVGATDVINYNWDAEESVWIINATAGSGAINTDALPEGTSNLYFTGARVLATLLSGLSLVTGGSIVSTDSVLVAFGKLQKQITDNITALGLKQNALTNPITGLGSQLDPNTYALQDGTILYHSVKWFTPTGTVSTSGTTVTSIGTQFASNMVGSKLNINGEWRIITAYTNTTNVTVASTYSQNYSGVVAGSWGVFSKAIEVKSDNSIRFYTIESGVQRSAYLDSYSGFYNEAITILNSTQFNSTGGILAADKPVKWTSINGNLGSAKDLGIRRNAAGVLEIYDGNTAGQYRDLILRALNISTSPATSAGTYEVLTRNTVAGVDFGKIEKKLSSDFADKTDTHPFAISDLTSALVTGDVHIGYAPYSYTMTSFWLSVKTAPTFNSIIVDVKKNGVSITSTKAGIDANENTSLTGTAPVLTTTTFLKGDLITANIFQVGTGETGKGLQLNLEIIKT